MVWSAMLWGDGGGRCENDKILRRRAFALGKTQLA